MINLARLTQATTAGGVALLALGLERLESATDARGWTVGGIVAAMGLYSMWKDSKE